MKTQQNTLPRYNFLIYSLISVVLIYIIANFFPQEDYPLAEDWYPSDVLYIIVPLAAIALGIILNIKHRLKGNHGKAWLLFTLAIASWFAGELTYDYEYEYDISDISTFTSDIFYIAGYPLFFGFTIFYFKPVYQNITKKNIILACFASVVIISPSLYLAFDYAEDVDELTLFLYAIYPILDGIILVPSIIVVFLFFGGKVNLFWTLILIAILMNVAADTVYLSSSIEDTFYPAHLINILWVWTYVLYTFGAYYHIKIFRIPSKTRIKNWRF